MTQPSYLPWQSSATPILAALSSIEYLPISFSLSSLMSESTVHTIAWGLRISYVCILLWWPTIQKDPIYTPRHARMTGQELSLPANASFTKEEDAHALAIFWGWEHRSLVATRWVRGPALGVRIPEGRTQTLIVLLCFWGTGSFLLSRLSLRTTPSVEQPRPSGPFSWLFTPIWQWFGRRS